MLFQVVGESKRMRRIPFGVPCDETLILSPSWRRAVYGSRLHLLLAPGGKTCRGTTWKVMPNGFISSGASLRVEPLTFQVVYCWRIQEGWH